MQNVFDLNSVSKSKNTRFYDRKFYSSLIDLTVNLPIFLHKFQKSDQVKEKGEYLCAYPKVKKTLNITFNKQKLRISNDLSDLVSGKYAACFVPWCFSIQIQML